MSRRRLGRKNLSEGVFAAESVVSQAADTLVPGGREDMAVVKAVPRLCCTRRPVFMSTCRSGTPQVPRCRWSFRIMHVLPSHESPQYYSDSNLQGD